MVKDTIVAGEASSSRPKRQKKHRVFSFFEDEAKDDLARSGTLSELDLLDCPICCHTLTVPIYQCSNGHIACSSCCMKMRNKCPYCTLRFGNYRCRIMERFVEAIIVPCPNAKYGCTEKFSCGKELVHEKECIFALCYCPAPNCNYTGVYKDLYSHYYANHKDTWNKLECQNSTSAWLDINEKILVFQYRDGPLFAFQSFKELYGVYVTVNCIAPSAPGVGEFSYDLSYLMAGKTMTFRSSGMNRIQKVSFQTPKNDFMIVPYGILSQCPTLKMKISICTLNKDEEEADEEDVDEGMVHANGEASTSRPKRQKKHRLLSLFEDEVQGREKVARSVTLSELDLLDCPICCHALTIPIFQCGDGHMACSSCCIKLRHKCLSCTLPIGNNRCRVMERVLEAIIVPCPNAKHGCTEKFSYGKELAHKKVCGFSLCYCPAPNCNYTGVYKDLYSHYNANHKNTLKHFFFNN